MITFTFSSLSVDPTKMACFNEELKEQFDKVVSTFVGGDTLEVRFDGSEDQAYEDSVTAWVNAFDSNDVEHQKIDRINEIDTKSSSLIKEGFDYDGHHFSMSQWAQINWTAMKAAEDLLPDPIGVTTSTEEQYNLAKANLNLFIGAALGHKLPILESGRLLKQAVLAATTQAELDAVVDNR